MKRLGLFILLLTLGAPAATAQATCLSPDSLIRLDAHWEAALRDSDVNFLRTHLAEDFIWVHNHRSLVDTKAAVVNRALDRTSGAAGAASARIQSDVEARVLGSTGIVTGFTLVDRGPEPTRYQFMRTYVFSHGRCLLLANQTMAVPEGED